MKKIRPVFAAYFNKYKEEYKKSFTISFGVFAIALLFLLVFINRIVYTSSHKKETEANLVTAKLEFRYSLMNSIDNVDNELENLETSWLSIENKALVGSSDDLIFSTILQIIETLAREREVTIQSYEFEEVKREGNFSLLPVRFEFSTRYESLVSLLLALENHAIYMRISNMDMQKLQGNNILIVRLVVEVLRHHEEQIQ